MTLHRSLRAVLFTTALATLFAANGCVLFGTPAGETCETTGDGFTRSDPCSTECFDYEGTCPGGAVTIPNQCVYGECEPEVTECETGQVCVQSNADRWYCVDDNQCPSGDS